MVSKVYITFDNGNVLKILQVQRLSHFLADEVTLIVDELYFPIK